MYEQLKLDEIGRLMPEHAFAVFNIAAFDAQTPPRTAWVHPVGVSPAPRKVHP
jgi:hypothetical protein